MTALFAHVHDGPAAGLYPADELRRTMLFSRSTRDGEVFPISRSVQVDPSEDLLFVYEARDHDPERGWAVEWVVAADGLERHVHYHLVDPEPRAAGAAGRLVDAKANGVIAWSRARVDQMRAVTVAPEPEQATHTYTTEGGATVTSPVPLDSARWPDVEPGAQMGLLL